MGLNFQGDRIGILGDKIRISGDRFYFSQATDFRATILGFRATELEFQATQLGNRATQFNSPDFPIETSRGKRSALFQHCMVAKIRTFRWQLHVEVCYIYICATLANLCTWKSLYENLWMCFYLIDHHHIRTILE